jgi:RNA polymerase sigma-70 factor (ECF subfamily)
MVYGLCRISLRDGDEAEDATQQVFLSAHRSLLAGTLPRDPAAWLATIARNECVRRICASPPEPVVTLEEIHAPTTEQGVAQRAEVEALCRAVAELPVQQRQAFVLREFYGLSYREVAVALSVSDSAVESLLFRGRRQLQEQLRPIRAAFGTIAVPWAVQRALGDVLPGFSAGLSAAGGGAGVAVVAKVAVLPTAVKVGAAVIVLASAGTLAGVESDRHPHATVTEELEAPVDALSLLKPSPAQAAAYLVRKPRKLTSPREGEVERLAFPRQTVEQGSSRREAADEHEHDDDGRDDRESQRGDD